MLSLVILPSVNLPILILSVIIHLNCNMYNMWDVSVNVNVLNENEVHIFGC